MGLHLGTVAFSRVRTNLELSGNFLNLEKLGKIQGILDMQGRDRCRGGWSRSRKKMIQLSE